MRRIEMDEAVQDRARVRDIYDDRQGVVIDRANALRLKVLWDGDEAAGSYHYGRLELIETVRRR